MSDVELSKKKHSFFLDKEMDFLEPTQRLDSTESQSDLSSVDDHIVEEKKIFGKLLLQDGTKSEFDIYSGENFIGRDPSKCQILLKSPSLSRIHAVIEYRVIEGQEVYYFQD